MENIDLKKSLKALLNDQKLGVIASFLGTSEPPYINLVAFANTPNLKNLIFATNRDTRKFVNIKNNPNISILIDNRGNQPSDFKDAVAVSVFGFAEEITGDREQFLNIYLSKHPYLEDFVHSPKCALFRIKVTEYSYVSHFQNVRKLKL